MSNSNLFGLAPAETKTESVPVEETKTEAPVKESVSTTGPVKTQDKVNVDTMVQVVEPKVEETKTEQPELLLGRFTQEQLQQIDVQFCNSFDQNPFQAIDWALANDIPLALSPERQELLNQKYLEWFDKDPINANAWMNKVMMKQHDQERTTKEEEHKQLLERQEEVKASVTEAIESIHQEFEYFKDPVFDTFLFDLANDLAERDMQDKKYANAGEIFKDAAQRINAAYQFAEKKGYEKAMAESNKKKRAYVEGSGNVIPPRSKNDDLQEAIANKDLDAILGIKLRNLKKV